MTLSELFQTLKTLSKADLNSVKQFLESFDYDYNGLRIFFCPKSLKTEVLAHIANLSTLRKTVIKA